MRFTTSSTSLAAIIGPGILSTMNAHLIKANTASNVDRDSNKLIVKAKHYLKGNRRVNDISSSKGAECLFGSSKVRGDDTNPDMGILGCDSLGYTCVEDASSSLGGRCAVVTVSAGEEEGCYTYGQVCNGGCCEGLWCEHNWHANGYYSDDVRTCQNADKKDVNKNASVNLVTESEIPQDKTDVQFVEEEAEVGCYTYGQVCNGGCCEGLWCEHNWDANGWYSDDVRTCQSADKKDVSKIASVNVGALSKNQRKKTGATFFGDTVKKVKAALIDETDTKIVA